MAITIRQQAASGVISGFNDIIFVVSSTNTAQANFQYVCDVYLTDDTGALTHAGISYLRTKTPVDPIYSSGVFNISDKVRNFMTYDNGTDAYGVQKSPNSVVQVICKFGEEYGPSSAVVVTADLATSNTFIAINSSLSDLEYNNTQIESTFGLTTGTSTTKRALTNRPNLGKIRSGEDAWLSYTPSSTNSMYNFVVETDTGSLLTSYYITNPYTTVTTSIGRRVQRVPSGIRNLGYLNSSHILTGQSSINFTDVIQYNIWMVNASSGQTSETQSYTIDTSCTDHTVYRLHFLNKWGGFDSFSFIKAHTERTEVSREKFKRNKITRIGGGRYGFNNYDLSDVQYNTKHKDTIKVISDWISEADSLWLEELCTSPVIFHDHPTYGRVPVNITDTSYDRKLWVTDKLFNLELSFQYSDDKYRQSL
jgi:hypothetical protein